MANVQVRGCCCGIPFGCGVLVLAFAAVGLWRLVAPHLWHPNLTNISANLAFLIVPGVVLVLAVGAGAKRR